MRKKINPKALCSSENYRESKKVHNDFLKREHEIFITLDIEVTKVKKPYIICFGKYCQVTEKEALFLKVKGYTIYYR